MPILAALPAMRRGRVVAARRWAVPVLLVLLLVCTSLVLGSAHPANAATVVDTTALSLEDAPVNREAVSAGAAALGAFAEDVEEGNETSADDSEDHRAPSGSKGNAKLAALVLLVIPVALLGYFGWQLWKRWRRAQLAREVKLSGSRAPGEVDDVDLGSALGGGEWLTRKQGSGVGGPGSPQGLAPADEFDPIARQAQAQRLKRERRRQYVDLDGRHSGEEGDRDDDSLDVSGGLGDGDGGEGTAAPIFAATLTNARLPLFARSSTDEPVPPLLPTEAAAFSNSAAAAPPAAATAARHYDPSDYSEANRVLLEQYSAATGPAAGTASAAAAAGGSGGAAVATREAQVAGGRGGPLQAPAIDDKKRVFGQMLSSVAASSDGPNDPMHRPKSLYPGPGASNPAAPVSAFSPSEGADEYGEGEAHINDDEPYDEEEEEEGDMDEEEEYMEEEEEEEEEEENNRHDYYRYTAP